MTNDDKTIETETAKPSEPETATPKKMLLTKRAVRHFNVRSGVQAGAWNDGSVCQSCTRIRCSAGP